MSFVRSLTGPVLDLPEHVQRDMREHSDNSQQDGDGLIFLNLCYYWDQNDEEQIKRWFAKWSANPSKIRDFRQLQTNDAARDLKDGLDKNRQYPGLWEGKGFKMGPFHRILTMRCPEVGHTIYRCKGITSNKFYRS